jgi:hypothetical protein
MCEELLPRRSELEQEPPYSRRPVKQSHRFPLRSGQPSSMLQCFMVGVFVNMLTLKRLFLH